MSNVQPSEKESRQVAEGARETEWKEPSFLKELFLGSLRFDLIDPFPEIEERAEFVKFFNEMKTFLLEKVDAVLIDTTGEYPAEVVDGLRKLGAFGMKIPKEYGGLGFSQAEYDKVMKLLGSVDGNVTALLSAHQSIGVPQPIKIFGTPEQKKKYLPRCAAGAISAFALTEPNVGSDPAALTTTAELTPEGDAYIINGEKLWCTNGALSELLVVMARHPNSRKISAFVVETNAPGVKIVHRSRFMGLHAIANNVISFDNVRVPVADRIGKEGAGLKIALVTLNTGRLALPAGCVGAAKVALEVCRRWGTERVQWGLPVGKHEVIAHKLADIAASTFAMEAITDIASRLSDRGGYDIRLEAAAAKLWNSECTWKVVDDMMQIRGGRGYETETSLKARGEAPVPVERMMRDARINRIFEGSSEVMHLFIAREAVDTHLQVAGAIIDDTKSIQEKLKALPAIFSFYAKWYPAKWLGSGYLPSTFRELGPLGRHLRFVERASRRLAREMFHGMVVFQGRLQRKQAFLFRAVDIGLNLFAMAASISRVKRMKADGHVEAHNAEELADLFCRNATRETLSLFHDMWSNDDEFKYKVARRVLDGKHVWLEGGTAGMDRIYGQAQKPKEQPKKVAAKVAEPGKVVEAVKPAEPVPAKPTAEPVVAVASDKKTPNGKH